jgi:hypothetical protein
MTNKRRKTMKKNSILMFAVLIVLTLAANSVSAQITISIPKIPKIPKIKKDKPKAPQTESPTTTDNNQTNDSQTNNNQSDNQSQDNQTEEDSEPQKEADKCETDAIAGLFADEIAKMIEDIDGYTPGRDWFYSGSPTRNYLLIAISPSERKGFKEGFISDCPKIVSGLEKLSVLAAKKLPTYKADLNDYTVRNAAEEKIMRTIFKNIANYQIYSVGLIERNWLIAKNDYGLPTTRYKHGAFYLKDKTVDHPYCYLTYVNIKQDYAGGGTYGASYATYIRDELVGCPAGK